MKTKSKSPMLDKAMAEMKRDYCLRTVAKPKAKQPPDWFGCGRTITAESWAGFIKARRKYLEQQDATSQPAEREQGA